MKIVDQIAKRGARKTGWLLFPFFLVPVFFVLALGAYDVRAEIVDRIVAVVNSEVITLSELERQAEPALEQYLQGAKASGTIHIRKQEIYAQILPQLIDDRLVQGEVKRIGIMIDDQDVDGAIERIARGNNMSRDELIERLADDGIGLEEYRGDIRKQIERSQLINAKVRSKIVITDEQIQAYLEENPPVKQASSGPFYVLQHISISPSERDNPQAEAEARKKAERAVKELKEGKAFEDVALRFSELPSAREGGKLGSFTTKEMAPFVKDAVLDLKPGEFSNVVDTPIGFQIFKLQTVIEESEHQNNEAHFEEVRQKLYRMQMDEQFQEWLRELRSGSTIRILL